MIGWPIPKTIHETQIELYEEREHEAEWAGKWGGVEILEVEEVGVNGIKRKINIRTFWKFIFDETSFCLKIVNIYFLILLKAWSN